MAIIWKFWPYTEEEIDLYYNKIYGMDYKFENTDIQQLRRICWVPDSIFFDVLKME